VVAAAAGVPIEIVELESAVIAHVAHLRAAMLFNSYQFIFLFLPIVVLGYFVLGRLGRTTAVVWLVLASLAFYAVSRVDSLAIILPSIVLDYAIGQALERLDDSRSRLRATLLGIGIVANIAGYLVPELLDTANLVFGTHIAFRALILPLGISFITFQKIAYLMDVYSGQVKGVGFLNFLLFTLFFPRVVAGPIVHYQEVMPQFDRSTIRWVSTDIAVAICLFSMGLFKKVVIADRVGDFANPVFAAPLTGEPVTLLAGWIGALAYTFQIYFDFSGYSDMAIGIARIFGVVLPMNFNSPLKATSIVEFWSRWHITLTRFLTAYVYTPLVLNLTRRRMAQGKPVLRGRNTRMSAILILIGVPTLVTMAISGFWHGVGFQFIVWGLLHGVMLTINQGWRTLRPRFWRHQKSYDLIMSPVGFLLTFGGVIVTLVFFRASSVSAALAVLRGMVGLNGVAIPHAIGSRLGAGAWLSGSGSRTTGRAVGFTGRRLAGRAPRDCWRCRTRSSCSRPIGPRSTSKERRRRARTGRCGIVYASSTSCRAGSARRSSPPWRWRACSVFTMPADFCTGSSDGQ
jgi:D-alanyl-lipoteichoic acid acyltransferase DltB (MBOAT superfamily)